MYHFCMKIWPYTFLALPFLNLIAVRGTILGTDDLDPLTIYTLWIGLTIVLCTARVAFLAYSWVVIPMIKQFIEPSTSVIRVNMLLVKHHAPNSSSLGSTTALVQFSICFSRAFAPAFARYIFYIPPILLHKTKLTFFLLCNKVRLLCSFMNNTGFWMDIFGS